MKRKEGELRDIMKHDVMESNMENVEPVFLFLFWFFTGDVCNDELCAVDTTEADMRIIPHRYWALNFEYDSFVVLTNDTDVLVLLLRYCAIFLRMKLKNLYKKIGTGTCKHPWKETVPKPIGNSHSHWVRLPK